MESKKLTGMMKEVNDAAAKYVKSYNSHEKQSTLKALKKIVNEKAAAYNLELSQETYRTWNKEGDPVKTAIRTRYIPNAIKVKYNVDDDNYMTASIVGNTNYEVNLPMIQYTLGSKVFSNPKWFNMCEKLVYVIADDINDRMGDNPMFKYEVMEASKAFNFDSDINMLEPENVLKAIQAVFDAILYIDNPDNPGTNIMHLHIKDTRRGEKDAKEWRSIRESMTSGTGDRVEICNTGTFSSIIMRVMHTMLTNGDIVFASEDVFGLSKELEAAMIKESEE